MTGLRARVRAVLCRVGWHRWLDTTTPAIGAPERVLVGRYCPFCRERRTP